MGTVGYMSPDQAQGKAVDQRSDIFSFGCILYEAATGSRPFEGDSAIDTLHKIIYSTPTPVTDLKPELPADLQRIIRRCLAKEPDKRYQTIRDVVNDLEDLRREIDFDSEVGRSIPPKNISIAGGTVSQATSSAVNSRNGNGWAPSAICRLSRRKVIYAKSISGQTFFLSDVFCSRQLLAARLLKVNR